MEILAPYILSAEVVDRWDIWQNTEDVNDLNFFTHLDDSFEKVRLVNNPDDQLDGCRSICQFFKTTIDPDTIYIRFDDDIVWLEKDFFKTFLDYRIDNPDFFLVFPGIINNAATTHLLQQFGKLDCQEYLGSSCFDKLGWENPQFAHELHEWFLRKIEDKNVSDLNFGAVPFTFKRVSINCFSWFGEEFSKFGGIIDEDEEEYITISKSRERKKLNVIFGETFVAHFSFYTQRSILDQSTILAQYRGALLNTSDKQVHEIHQKVCHCPTINSRRPSRPMTWEKLIIYGELYVPVIGFTRLKHIKKKIRELLSRRKSSYLD